MTFDIGQRVAAERRRMVGTAGLVAFVLAILAGVAVLLLARSGPGPATAEEADGASPSAVSASGAASETGTSGAPAAAADTGVGAASRGGPADDAAAGGAAPGDAVAATDDRPEVVPQDASAPVDPAMANVPDGLAPDPSGGGFVPPARRVSLPLGAEQVEEYPVRFPLTPEGAAAAAVALTRYSATLDYLTAHQVMRLYVAPEYATAADGAAKGAVEAARTRLGVPLAGDPPPDASMVAMPVGVQWETPAAEEGAAPGARVSVLSVAEYRFADRLEREIVSLHHYLVWDGGAGDWRFVPPPDGGPAGPAQAEIGTQAFNDNGWSAITEEHP